MSEATSVGQIGLDLVINQGQFNRQLNGITKVAKKAGTALAAAFGVKKLVSFGKQCINLGSDLQEVQNVVDTTFTSMSSKVDKFAKDSMKNFGLSETMSKKYTGTLGAMAKAFGFSEKQAYDMSTTLTGLAGDIASFYNISQDEAFTKLKAVFTGETEALKELGIVMTQSALDQHALANGFGKTTAAMTEAEKVALRYAFVQSKLSTAAGDFARTSGGWANQMRVLNLQFESFKASIGQGLINVLTPALRMINQVMSGLVNLANAFKNFTGLFVKSNKTAESAKNIANSYNAAAQSSTAFGSVGTNAMNKVGKAAEKASKKMRTLMGFDQINKVSESEDTSNSGSSSGGGATTSPVNVDVGPGEEEIKPLPKAYERLAQSIERFKTACSGLATVVSGGLKWGYENILKPLGKWTLNKLAPGLLDVFSGAIRVLTEVLKALGPLGTWFWEKFLSKIASFAGGAIIKFLELFASGLNKLADWISKHQTAVQNIAIALGGMFVAFKGATVISTIIGAFTKFGGVINFLGGPLKIVTTLFKNLPFFISCFAPAISPATVAIGALIGAGVLLWKNWDKIKKKGKAFFKSFNNGCKEIEEGIDEVVEGVKTIPDKVKKLLSGAEEWFSGIKEGLHKTLKKLTKNLPNLSDVSKKVTEAIGEIKANIKGNFLDKKADLTSKWNELTANVKEKTADLKAKVATKWSDLQASWSGIVNNIQNKTADLKARVASTWQGLAGSWGNIVNNIKDKTADMKAKVATKVATIKNAWESLSAKWKDKKAEFSLKFSTAVSDLKSWVNTNVIDKVNSKFKKVPILKNHLIPHLAQGGYVAKNTPQLAMIGDNRHQGEVVSPEKKLEEMALKAAQMAGGMGNTEIISLLRQILAAILALNLTVNLDGKNITDNVVKRINDITKSTGTPPIII